MNKLRKYAERAATNPAPTEEQLRSLSHQLVMVPAVVLALADLMDAAAPLAPTDPDHSHKGYDLDGAGRFCGVCGDSFPCHPALVRRALDRLDAALEGE